MNQTFIATCPSETQAILRSELVALGATDIREGYKALRFSTKSLSDSYQIHLKLRTASRLMKIIKEYSGCHIGAITKQSSRLSWLDHIRPGQTYLIEGVVGDRGQGIPSGNSLSKAVRLGMEYYFEKNGLQKPEVDLKNPDFRMIAYLHKGRVVLSLDSSGKTMHKRGYRGEGHPAPIKETLAAALLQMMGFDGSQVLYDPMCGSGTVLIEGAYISLNKAALIHRKQGEFGIEKHLDFDKQEWRRVQDSIRAEKHSSPANQIFGSDININFIDLAKENALRARVERYIKFKHGDFFTLPAPAPSGMVLCNLPYGERLKTSHSDEDMRDFYKAIGDKLKSTYQGWKVGLLAHAESPYKFIGLRPSRKIPILNGSIPCKLLIFDIYKGSKKSDA